MIDKDLDPLTPTDNPLVVAGRKAENQMAFYLRRAFAADPMVRVLNGIRLEAGGDVAQIDHLVLLPWLILIIESKSVTTKVQINDHGEWARWVNGAPHGMPSPILQAKRQGEFLKAYLEHHSKELRDRSLFRPRGFSELPFDVLVAISDSGIVERPKRLPVDEVCKADQVVDQIRDLIKHSRKVPPVFSQGELEKISAFLVSHHKPATVAQSTPAGVPQSTPAGIAHARPAGATPLTSGAAAGGSAVAQPPPVVETDGSAVVQPETPPRTTLAWVRSVKAHSCHKCGGTNLSVRPGRYGYYYKCHLCGANTHIDTTCPRCGGAETIRKNGEYYLADCHHCGTSTVIYPAPAAGQETAVYIRVPAERMASTPAKRMS